MTYANLGVLRGLWAVMAVAIMIPGAARADVISGPVLGSDSSGYQYTGLGFTATVNSTLTSFTFENQGNADTIDLVDATGNVLDFVGTPSGTPSDTVSVSWSLTAGDQYYLLQSQLSNSLFGSWGSPAPSDTQIALTNTGDLSLNSLNSHDAGFYDISSLWVAFNDITTTSASAPEPASAILILPFLVAVLWFGSRKALARTYR